MTALDPITIAVGKSALPAASKAVLHSAKERLIQDAAIRKAQAGEHKPCIIEAEVNKLLDVFCAAPDTFWGNICNKTSKLGKGLLPQYDQQAVKDFFNDIAIRNLLKNAVLQKLSEGEENDLMEIARLYSEKIGEHIGRATPFIKTTVTTLASALQTLMSSGEQTLAGIMKAQAADIKDRNDANTEKIVNSLEEHHRDIIEIKALLQPTREAFLNSPELQPFLPNELCSDYLIRIIERLEKQMFLSGFDRYQALIELYERTENGDLIHADTSAKIRLLQAIIESFCNANDIAKAREFLSYLQKVATNQHFEQAQATIYYAEHKFDLTIGLLKESTTPAGVGLFFLALSARDGVRAAYAQYCERECHTVLKGIYLLEFALTAIRDKKLEIAKGLLDNALPGQLDECPMLFAARYSTYLMLAAPFIDSSYIPITAPVHPASVMFNELPEYCTLREKALEDAQHFLKSMQALDSKGDFSSIEEIVLWLQLSSPNVSVKKEAENKLHKFASLPVEQSIKHLRFLLDYGIINSEQQRTFRDYLDQLIATGEELTFEHLLAKFLLTLRLEEPQALLTLLEQYRDKLADIISEDGVKELEIEANARAGELQVAQDKIDQYFSEDENGKTYSESVVDWVCDKDRLEASKKAFLNKPALNTRHMLIDDLLISQKYNEAVQHLLAIFNTVQTSLTVKKIAHALISAKEYEQLASFLNRPDVIELEKKDLEIKTCRGWLAFYQGNILEAKTLARELIVLEPSKNNITLFENTTVASFSIDELYAYLATQVINVKELSLVELARKINLSISIGFRGAHHFLYAMGQKGLDEQNPEALMTAYFLAVQLGIEDETTSNWMAQAIKLSGDTGPVQTVDIKEFPEFAEKHRSHTVHVNNLIRSGDGILEFVAERFNTTLTSIILGGLVANSLEYDFRKKQLMPLYAASRGKVQLPSEMKCIALDRTALMTLSYLNLLPMVFDFFDVIEIGQRTITEFLGDLQKIPFHQPSLLVVAQSILDFVESKQIHIVNHCPVQNKELFWQVGEELERLIIQAEQCDGVVIVSPPIHIPGDISKGLQIANTKSWQHLFCDIATLEKWLYFNGYSFTEDSGDTDNESTRWKSCSILSYGKKLYIDDLALDALAKSSLLHVVVNVFEVHIDSITETSRRSLLAHSRMLQGTKQKLLELLDLLHQKILVDKVKLTQEYTPPSNEKIGKHSFVEVLLSSVRAESICVDDRSLNRMQSTTNALGKVIPIITTLDLLHYFNSQGILSDDMLMLMKQKLHIGGVAFIPNFHDELQYAGDSQHKQFPIPENKVLMLTLYTNFFLKADFFRFPDDIKFLVSLRQQLQSLIITLWNKSSDSDNLVPQCDVLLETLYSVETFLLAFTGDRNKIIQYRATLLVDLIVSVTVEGTKKEKYFSWLEQRAFKQLFECSYGAEHQLAKYVAEYLRELADFLKENHPLNASISVVEIFKRYYHLLPYYLQKLLLAYPGLPTLFDFDNWMHEVTVINGCSINAKSLFDAFSCIANNKQPSALQGESGDVEAMLCFDDGYAIVNSKGQCIGYADVGFLCDDFKKRQLAWKKANADYTLTRKDYDEWNDKISKAALEYDDFYQLKALFDKSPQVQAKRTEILQLFYDFVEVLPLSKKTFEALLGKAEYSKEQPYSGISPIWMDIPALALGDIYNWLLAIGPSYLMRNTDIISFALELDRAKLCEAITRIVTERYDPCTLLLCFDICAAGCEEHSDFVERGTEILDLLFAPSSPILKAYEVALTLVLGAMTQTQMLHEAPLYYQRLAGWTWAGYVSQNLLNRNIDWSKAEVSGFAYQKFLRDLSFFVKQGDSTCCDNIGLSFLGLLGFIHRHVSSALNERENAPALWCEKVASIGEAVNIFHYLPGPLDEFVLPSKGLNDLTAEEVATLIENSDNKSSAEWLKYLRPFVSIANIPQEIVEKVIAAGKDILFFHIEETEYTVPAVNCLARLASTSHNVELAQLATTIAHRYTASFKKESAIFELQVILEASSAFINLDSKNTFLKQSLENLALGPMTKSVAEHCLVVLQIVTQIDPTLMQAVKGAYAAINIARFG